MTIRVDPDWWKSMFDDVYLTTDARSVCDDRVTAIEVDAILKLVPLKTDARILDLCGGHGRHTFELCRRGFTGCTVIDYSRSLLQKGAEKARRQRLPVRFITADARRIPVSSEAFHQVMILGNSLGYAAAEAADVQIVSEAYRALKPEGRLLLDVVDGERMLENFCPNAWHEIGEDVVVCRQREIQGESVSARELVVSKHSGIIRDRTYRVRLFNADKLEDLLRRVGFEDISIHTDFSFFETDQDVGFMNNRMFAAARRPR